MFRARGHTTRQAQDVMTSFRRPIMSSWVSEGTVNDAVDELMGHAGADVLQVLLDSRTSVAVVHPHTADKGGHGAQRDWRRRSSSAFGRAYVKHPAGAAWRRRSTMFWHANTTRIRRTNGCRSPSCFGYLPYYPAVYGRGASPRATPLRPEPARPAWRSIYTAMTSAP